tara:strand:- start:22570 stop:23340 length:771 start_codon:yes stop_codon:yes gene_type:complete
MNKYSILKAVAISLLMVFGMISCSSSSDEETIDTSTTQYDITSILSKFNGTGLIVSTNGNTVTFTTQNLPNHKSPYWPTNNALYEAYTGSNGSFNLNPNTISSQNISITMPLNPSEASNKQATSLGPIGVSVNGVVFYNQYAGPNNQALTNEINSFDQFLGHPQNSGQYHYHVEPTYLTSQFGNDAFLGLLADGFPVYGPVENGKTITNSDLDAYHGHTSATADFPNGIYHYHITPNEDPYINGNGFYGTPGNITQ